MRFVTALAFLAACSTGDTDGDQTLDGLPIDGSTETDADTDADADTDTDTDADTDGGSAPDSDNDGLTDEEEDALGTDPNDDDSDDDGLTDGVEVNDTQTDPNDPDSDDDGLLDGVEVYDTRTDPNDSDSDDDGLPDGDEITEMTDPNDPDTDHDGLLDGDEVTRGTNPIEPDTDQGGVDDGTEVLVDGTNPNDPTDDLLACVYDIDVDLVDLAYLPPLPAFDPTWMSFEWDLLSDANGLHDFWIDIDGDGMSDPATEEGSSALIITLWGPEFNELCSVAFDADAAVANAAPAWAGAAAVYEAFDLTVADGTTDCPALDPLVYGTDDIRDLLSQISWGVAMGELGDVAAPLEDAVTAFGLDWAADWAPFVYGAHISWDQLPAESISYGFVAEAVCQELSLDADGLSINVPAQATVPDGLRFTNPWFVVPFEDVTGIECLEADLTAADPTAVPLPFGMSPAFVAYDIQFAQDPTGGVRDFYLDADLDGIADAFNALAFIDVYDAGFGLLCTMIYDIDGAVEIDPTTWTAVDGTGAPSGPITQAWEVSLADGISFDCGEVSPAVFGSTDLDDYLSSLNVGLGIGPSVELAALGPALWGADWAAVEPQLFSVYVTHDGVTALEASYASTYDTNDCSVADPALIPFLKEDVGTPGLILANGAVNVLPL